MRLLCLTLVTTAVGALSACGGDSDPAPPVGSPENPAVARMQTDVTREPASLASSRKGGASNPAAAPDAAEQPDYQKLLERQSRRRDGRFHPCDLVTAAEARAILRGPIHPPVEAPQGPTCIYRTRAGERFITLAIQRVAFDQLRREMRRRRRIEVGGRRAYCGAHGQPVLYLRVSPRRVLSVAAPCSIARRFAARASARLPR